MKIITSDLNLCTRLLKPSNQIVGTLCADEYIYNFMMDLAKSKYHM